MKSTILAFTAFTALAMAGGDHDDDYDGHKPKHWPTWSQPTEDCDSTTTKVWKTKT